MKDKYKEDNAHTHETFFKTKLQRINIHILKTAESGKGLVFRLKMRDEN